MNDSTACLIISDSAERCFCMEYLEPNPGFRTKYLLPQEVSMHRELHIVEI